MKVVLTAEYLPEKDDDPDAYRKHWVEQFEAPNLIEALQLLKKKFGLNESFTQVIGDTRP
jgi:hypothetical protein